MFKCKNCTNENNVCDECNNARYDDENWCVNVDLEIVNDEENDVCNR